MPLNLASPGVLVREVDLTVGRIDPVSPSVGALAAPFAKGPVGEPTLIQNENDLLNTFGKPYNNDKHYEHWMVASSYLAYGGSLQIVRTDDDDMKNAKIGAASSVKIRSTQHYNELGYTENKITDVVFAAKNPGSWGNALRVALIDSKADQTLTGITTTQVTTFVGVATYSDGDLGITTTQVTLADTTDLVVGQVINPISGIVPSGTTIQTLPSGSSGIVTFNQATTNTIALDNVSLSFGSNTEVSKSIDVGDGITQAISVTRANTDGTTTALDGVLKGVVTGVGAGEVYVKVVAHVSAASTETNVDYEKLGDYRFADSGNFTLFEKDTTSSAGTVAYTGETDWFDAQKITLSSGSQVSWSGLAQRPQTSEYANSRGARFDEVHVVVYDDNGSITGNAGTVLEKHLALSKAKDARFSSGSPSYWRKFLAENSEYVFAGSQPAGVVVVDHQSGKYELVTDTDWDQDAGTTSFACIGNYNNLMSGGLNYAGISTITTATALKSSLSKLISGYNVFVNEENTDIDFLLMGSGNHDSVAETKALANKLIAVAEARQDAVAFISPYRAAAITDTDDQTISTVRDIDTITTNVLSFYSSITSSTYGVFDSGYKYMYDRFNDTFRYVPLNGDIAGLCARTDANAFPWFSPAGTDRGAILNAVKLAYNPGKLQRDQLYSERVNPVITSRGQGTILFGDKTAYAKSSAFDRINVRRLFIYLENAISAAARDQLFEFNDELTRTNFVNIVEPFLRDVQSKRGIYDFVVICDQTNNTPAVIDNNEFVADIYIKPAKSINFIGLTFVATRTGVSFEEVIGNV